MCARLDMYQTILKIQLMSIHAQKNVVQKNAERNKKNIFYLNFVLLMVQFNANVITTKT